MDANDAKLIERCRNQLLAFTAQEDQAAEELYAFWLRLNEKKRDAVRETITAMMTHGPMEILFIAAMAHMTGMSLVERDTRELLKGMDADGSD